MESGIGVPSRSGGRSGRKTQDSSKNHALLLHPDISARIGRFLPYEELEEMTQGMARSEAYRLIAAFVRHEVVNLRDRTRDTFDAMHLRNQMKNERRTPLIESEEVEESAASMI